MMTDRAERRTAAGSAALGGAPGNETQIGGTDEMAIATLKVEGMTCEHCVRAVTRALEETDGVTRAQVELEAGRARVEYDEARTDPRQLAGAVMEEGYVAEELP